MLVSKLVNRKLYIVAPGKKKKLGRIHHTVFSPDGLHLVGFMVKRSDIAGVIQRDDLFVSLDEIKYSTGEIWVEKDSYSKEDIAINRLGINLDLCLIWIGMDVKSLDGIYLGQILDIEVDDKTGSVINIYVCDNSLSEALIGTIEIPSYMYVKYSEGAMIVDERATKIESSGGLAQKSAICAHEIKRSAQSATEKIDGAGKKKADELRQMVKDTTDAFEESSKSSGEIDRQNPAFKLGRQLSKSKTMFSSFINEYKKSSK